MSSAARMALCDPVIVIFLQNNAEKNRIETLVTSEHTLEE
jgi:hypothetical protein